LLLESGVGLKRSIVCPRVNPDHSAPRVGGARIVYSFPRARRGCFRIRNGLFLRNIVPDYRLEHACFREEQETEIASTMYL
jgi:hypothetical protein